jgi:hypothetical protein
MSLSRTFAKLGLVTGLMFTAIFSGVPAQAQKKGGGGGPVPPGVIYFTSNGSASAMAGDGSGKVATRSGEPSHLRHGGRWFLFNRTVDETGPGRWFAVNDAGPEWQLTIDPTDNWNGVPPAWAKDDSFFTFTGIEETATEWVGRLYLVPLTWVDDRPEAGTPRVVFEDRRSVFNEWGDYSYEGLDEVDFHFHDWAPGGTELALTRWVWGTGWVIDVLSFTPTGTTTRRLVTNGGGPKWSPDGTRVAFHRLRYAGNQEIQDVWTILADGTAPVQLTAYVPGRDRNGTSQSQPSWSPDGAYLSYTERVISNSKVTWNVCRIPSTGGSKVALTSDGRSSFARWRQ